jgi:hypothetical protein
MLLFVSLMDDSDSSLPCRCFFFGFEAPFFFQLFFDATRFLFGEDFFFLFFFGICLLGMLVGPRGIGFILFYWGMVVAVTGLHIICKSFNRSGNSTGLA